MKLSIVATLYKSSKYINEFNSRISHEVKKITDDYELIFVDDGSPDDSLNKAVFLQEKDRKIKIIELSRNFGHHKAIMTGLSHAKGDFVFLIDSDLEEDPELLGRFWKEMQSNNNFDVVYGVQKERKGGWFERNSGRIFYYIFNKLVDEIEYPIDTLTSRIMTKRYVDDVIKHKESEYDLWSIFGFTGYKSKGILCNKEYKGSTTYTFAKKIDMAINIIASTSKKPLQLIFYFGSFISLTSFIYLVYLFILSFTLNTPPGWSSLMVILVFILGVLILSMGILGIYISVIFQESKKRPVIIKEIHKSK